jgi:hypothetical protein
MHCNLSSLMFRWFQDMKGSSTGNTAVCVALWIVKLYSLQTV